MKKILSLSILAVLMITTCKPKTETAKVNIESPKEAINTFLEKYHAAFNAKDINTIKTMLADDGLYCGTDSKELLNKDSVLNLIARLFADTSFIPNYKVDKREIRINEDGKEAVALEQFTIVSYRQKIPMRFISNLHKKNNEWKFDFGSYSYIPENEDIGKIKKTFEQ